MMTRRPRPLHPADLANAEAVAKAIRFDLALFLGTGQWATDTATTLAEAREKAIRLAAKIGNGRRALIYGITAEGRSGLVTDAILATLEKDTTTMSSKSKTKRTPEDFVAEMAAKAKGKPAKALKAKAEVLKEPKPKAPKKAKAPKTEVKAKAERPLGKRAAIEAAAREGKVPHTPDFSAATHERFRPKLAEVVALVKEGNLRGLKAFEIKANSSSPKAILRYRDLCVLALSAKS
jgi:hypothetical protein